MGRTRAGRRVWIAVVAASLVAPGCGLWRGGVEVAEDGAAPSAGVPGPVGVSPVGVSPHPLIAGDAIGLELMLQHAAMTPGPIEVTLAPVSP